MAKTNPDSEVACTMLQVTTPARQGRHVLGMLIVQDGIDADATVLSTATRIRSTQENLDKTALYFQLANRCEIENCITDYSEVKTKYNSIGSALFKALKKRSRQLSKQSDPS